MTAAGHGHRLAIFTHSIHPRGGVVHALQLTEALCARGLDATLLAPQETGQALFRTPRCPWQPIPAAPAPGSLESLVATRRREIAAFLRGGARHFDLFHAQDSISALALSDLAEQGHIAGYARTVHHLDVFANPSLSAWQDRAVRRAARLFCVSRLWQAELRRRFGRASHVVGNGVDTERFTPAPRHATRPCADGSYLGGGRIVLAIGGVEARKNTLGIVHAFLEVLRRGVHPDLRLLIAGGASLLDHAQTQHRLRSVVRASAHADRILLAGVIDDDDMPALYRIASMLCFPSLHEGFGLCVLEAMASGIPVIVPRGAPFDEYLTEADALRVDPGSRQDIADAIVHALRPEARDRAARLGPPRARGFGWDRVAGRHLEAALPGAPAVAHDA